MIATKPSDEGLPDRERAIESSDQRPASRCEKLRSRHERSCSNRMRVSGRSLLREGKGAVERDVKRFQREHEAKKKERLKLGKTAPESPPNRPQVLMICPYSGQIESSNPQSMTYATRPTD